MFLKIIAVLRGWELHPAIEPGPNICYRWEPRAGSGMLQQNITVHKRQHRLSFFSHSLIICILMRICALGPLFVGSLVAWTCPKSVSHETWQELVPFLQGEEVVKEGLCHIHTTDGNYTGQAEGGLAHGWGEMRWKNGSR